ncbi:MAG: GNAT family N-acetyltransferase [Candidatus Dormibacteraeota bacterium]|nr:GNAT family N-acetyltransferase [Candidatus Dormibacteraeota bacterium]
MEDPLVVVRPATAADFAEAGAVTAAAYCEFITPGDSGAYLDRLRDVASRADVGAVLVAQCGDSIAGTATLEITSRVPSSWPAEPLAPDEAHLRMLGVDPRFRGCGLGRQLVEAAIDTARLHGRTRITLDTTREMTAAQALYRSMGFRYVGTSLRHPEMPLLMFELSLV